MITERDAFGPSLKAERDRRGITLQAISDSTKIAVSLLAALERNDVSRWPKGIFRRAFVREYVTALGLPPEPFVAEFVRLFPDDPCLEAAPATPCPDTARATEFRLTLESEPSATRSMIRARASIAIIEVSSVLAVGSTLAWLLETQVWLAIGVLAVVYYPLANVFLERTPRPRLLFQPAGPARWLRRASVSLRRVRPQWPRPQVSARSPVTEGTEATANTAPEWRTASN